MPALFEKRKATARELAYMSTREEELARQRFGFADLRDWCIVAGLATSMFVFVPLAIVVRTGLIEPSRNTAIWIMLPASCLVVWATRKFAYKEKHGARLARWHNIADSADLFSGDGAVLCAQNRQHSATLFLSALRADLRLWCPPVQSLQNLTQGA